MSNVKIIGMYTGEQLLTEVVTTGVGKGNIMLKKPALLVSAGEKGLGLAPWLPYTNSQTSGIVIKEDAVMYITDPVEELKNHYTGVFVGGLVVPSKEVATPQLQLSEG